MIYLRVRTVSQLILVEIPEEVPGLHADWISAEVHVAVLKHRLDMSLQKFFFDDVSAGAIFLGL